MITGRTWASLKKKKNIEEHFNCQLLQSQPSLPVAAHVARQEPFVCFGLGFSALLAPLAPLAMSVHSCVEFRAKKKASFWPTDPCVCDYAAVGGIVSEPSRRRKEKRRRKNKTHAYNFWPSASGKTNQRWVDSAQWKDPLLATKVTLAYESEVFELVSCELSATDETTQKSQDLGYSVHEWTKSRREVNENTYANIFMQSLSTSQPINATNRCQLITRCLLISLNLALTLLPICRRGLKVEDATFTIPLSIRQRDFSLQQWNVWIRCPVTLNQTPSPFFKIHSLLTFSKHLPAHYRNLVLTGAEKNMQACWRLLKCLYLFGFDLLPILIPEKKSIP